MGIKGTVRRGTDGHLIHANIDTDIIVRCVPLQCPNLQQSVWLLLQHELLLGAAGSLSAVCACISLPQQPSCTLTLSGGWAWQIRQAICHTLPQPSRCQSGSRWCCPALRAMCACCSEEPAYGSDRKPDEMYHIIEHFVMGRRRLELFGEDHNVRPGWVTVGSSLSASNFDPQVHPEL